MVVRFGGLLTLAVAENVTIHRMDYPYQGFCGQEANVQKSWLNTHYFFPMVFGGFKEGGCADEGFAQYKETVVVEKNPIPWRHHNLTFDVFAASQTETLVLEFTDPSRPKRTVRVKFCMPGSNGSYPLYIFGHGAGCAPEDYNYFCQAAATAMIFQKSPAGDIFPVDFDSAEAALDARFLSQRLLEVASTEPSSPLYGRLDGSVILGGHSMGGGMSVLAAGKEHAEADGLALFAPGLYTKPDATEYLGAIDVPTLIVSGAMDCDQNSLDKQAQPAFDGLASKKKVLVVLKGANHCQWTQPLEKGLGVCKTFEKNECHDISRAVQHRFGASLVKQFSEALKGSWDDFEASLQAGEVAGNWSFFSSVTSDAGKILHNDCPCSTQTIVA